jgi:ribonuclease VapC
MVLDTSALLGLLLDEPEAEDFRAAVEDDTTRLVSAATQLETALVIGARKGEPGWRELDNLIQKADVVVVPVDAEHVSEARRAYRRFGKGRHATGLNFGDLSHLETDAQWPFRRRPIFQSVRSEIAAAHNSTAHDANAADALAANGTSHTA